VGIQLEEPSTREILDALDTAVSAHPDVALLVMSEYSLGEPPPEAICAWCRRHERYLVIGGKQPLPPTADGREPYANTAFVIDPKGEVVFSQGKSVPIQFFDDGVSAKEQRVWESPWGKVGICICYDLSYTRVTDELVRQGAQILIVPTMDAEQWGAYEHGLHARIGPVRAMEYGIPIVRVGSSGISQIVWPGGSEMARGSYPGRGEMVAGMILGYRPYRSSGLPVDRHFAPVCVVATGCMILMLLGWKPLNRFWIWRKTRWNRNWPGLRG
jgi:apolipoprotein N-acyltransferase